MLAADGKLFAITLDGRIMAFGPAAPASGDDNLTAGTKQGFANENFPSEDSPISDDSGENAGTDQRITEILSSGAAEGYGLWFGKSDSALATEITKRSPFVQLAIVDPEVEAINRTRRRLDRQDLSGRITVHHSEVDRFQAPKYVANMVMVDRDSVARVRRRRDRCAL